MKLQFYIFILKLHVFNVKSKITQYINDFKYYIYNQHLKNKKKLALKFNFSFYLKYHLQNQKFFLFKMNISFLNELQCFFIIIYNYYIYI